MSGGTPFSPRPPPGAQNSAPVLAAIVGMMAYYTYSVHYGSSSAARPPASSNPKPDVWWRPSN
eukprot:CAMPEP_0197612194 /NCGR_PEP_ID=MMETSP1326-20131121/56833_1 /TAXON_ID=1155430 /ORGANISM="Genus nov. species nov., Strain RCC2288" /LENGTH=62 /DNA_ID=CAMNT_0043180919 /DNA_START=121 /DNA_END=309 /DNA_ORIENTATION=-